MKKIINNAFLKTTLMDLLNIESFSKNESKVFSYIIPLLKEFGFEIAKDDIGNLYAVRGESKAYPMLNAHMDSVEGSSYVNYNTYTYQTKNCLECEYVNIDLYDINQNEVQCSITAQKVKYWKACNCKDYAPIICFDGEEEEEPSSSKTFTLKYDQKTKKIESNETRPMGGDDKCGIAIALDIARTTTIPMKIFFSVQEEIGCKGAIYAHNTFPSFFKDVLYGITIDRKAGNHICVTTGSERNASNYFIAELAKWAIISNIPVSLEKGTMSDNFTLKNLVSNFVNISAGYYNPHRNSEYIKFDEVKLIKNWIKNFLLKGDIK